MFAAAYFTECIVTKKASGSFKGIKDNYIDILVNLRYSLTIIIDLMFELI